MAYLDFLNTPGVKPDPADRYWYRHHHAWDRSKEFFDSCTDVRKGRVVHKLRQEHAQSGYEFEFEDEPGKVYHCNYTWAFARVSARNWWLVRLVELTGGVMSLNQAVRSWAFKHLDSLQMHPEDPPCDTGSSPTSTTITKPPRR